MDINSTILRKFASQKNLDLRMFTVFLLQNKVKKKKYSFR